MILLGNCLDVLKTLPANSVHMVVTSPPYWSLRDYGVPPSIWGGDPVCPHVWTSAGSKEGYGAKKKWQHSMTNAVATNGRGEPREREGDKRARKREDGGWTQIEQGKFCAACGAWRGCLGLEPTIDLYVEHLVAVFDEVRRVLRKDGTCWLNLGDSYAQSGGDGGSQGPNSQRQGRLNLAAQTKHGGTQRPPVGLKPKDLCMIPARAALALQASGWYLRADIIWAKNNPMPESTKDRPTKAHEYVFLLAKSEKYFYDADAIREGDSGRSAGNRTRKFRGDHGGNPALKNAHQGFSVPWKAGGGRNRRSVWTLSTKPFKGAHFATFPPRLVEPCILAGTSAHGCCATCGAGFARIVRLGDELIDQKVLGGCNKDGQYHGGAQKDYAAAGAQDPSAVKKRILKGMRERLTVGWKPTCRCSGFRLRTALSRRLERPWYRQRWQQRIDARWGGLHGLRRPVVLDPFGGSGTTALVAERLGRDYLLIELGAHNVAMAEERVAPARAEVSA